MITFLGQFGGAPKPQNSIKNYFLVVLDYFSYNNGPYDSVRGLFSSFDIGTYILTTCRPMSTFLGQLGGAQMSPNSIEKLFSGCFGHLSYKNEPNDLVRGLFSSLDIGKYI
jgi:hypothetical protein